MIPRASRLSRRALAAMVCTLLSLPVAGAGVPVPAPRPIDKALASPITLNAQAQPLRTFTAMLGKQANINLVVNWPAFANVGLTPETPVTLRLTDLPTEAAIRTLLDSLPTTAGELPQLNYTVGDNAVELTTNADLGKAPITRLYDLSILLNRSANGKATTQQSQHAELLLQVIRAQWKWAGEPPAGTAGRTLLIQDNMLIANASRRAQLLIQKVLALFSAPTPPGQVTPAAVLSVRARRTTDALKPFTDRTGNLPLAAWAAGTTPVPLELNVITLPTARAELSRPAPQLDVDITDAGVLEIDSRGHLRQRVVLGMYDLRDLLKRLARAKQTQAQFLAALQQAAPTLSWGDFDKSPAALAVYESTLLLSAPAATHRALARTLQELYN